jgi:PAS domain S-box-containing protein
MLTRVLHLLIYSLLAFGGLFFASLNANTSPIWPAAGFAIGICWRYGFGSVPVVFLGALLANLYAGSPLWVSLLVACGNTLEAHMGARILANTLERPSSNLEEPQIRALVFASVLAPLFSSVIGTTALQLGGISSLHEAADVFATWTLGNISGIFLVLPFFLFIEKPSIVRPQNWLRNIVFVLTLLTSLYFIFNTQIGKPWLFLVFFFTLAARLWWGGIATHVVTAFISIYALIAALHHTGPFVWSAGLNNNITSLQLFLVSLLATSVVLGFSNFPRTQLFIKRFLIIGWTICGAIFIAFYNFHHSKDENKFNALVAAAMSNLEYRFSVYEYNLRSAGTYLATTNSWSREKWHNYFSTLNILELSPGIKGMGIITTVTPKNRESFLQARRNEGLVDFSYKSAPGVEITPLKKLTDYRVIRYLEPRETNAEAWGLVLNSEARRAEALDLSLQRQTLTSYPPVPILQDPKLRLGIALLFPIPKHRSEPTSWVFAPLVLEDFFNIALAQAGAELDYWIFYDQPSGSNFVYGTQSLSAIDTEANAKLYPLTRHLTIAIRTFRIIWKPSTRFTTSFDFGLSLIAGMSAILVLFMAWFLLSASNLRHQLELALVHKTKEIVDRESMWRTLTNHSPVGIVTASIDGKCLYVNPKWEELAGIKFEEAFDYGWGKAVHPDDYARIQKEWSEFAASSRDWETMLRFLHPDGTVKWVSLRVAKIYKGNVFHYCIGILIDKTLQVEQEHIIEDERLRAQEAAKMASLGRMAGGIAHEINNPLTIIHAKAAQILRHAPEELREDTQKIVTMVDRITKIIRGLRTFSRNSTSKDPLVRVPVRQVLEDTLSLCSEQLSKAGIEIEVLGDWTLPVRCRPVQLSQVLINLIANSQDALQPLNEKWIALEAARINGDRVQIRITDSGRGLNREIADKILDPFFTTKDVGKGTGLGLSISRAIVEDHAGSLKLDANAANTTFLLTLPAAFAPTDGETVKVT